MQIVLRFLEKMLVQINPDDDIQAKYSLEGAVS
jgi:hypothetical protein